MKFPLSVTTVGLICTVIFSQLLKADEAFIIFEYNSPTDTAGANSSAYVVQSGDTLARIVVQYYGNVANPKDIFLQIVAQNPQAFVGGDPNRLLSGATLNLSGSTVTPRDRRDEIYFF